MSIKLPDNYQLKREVLCSTFSTVCLNSGYSSIRVNSLMSRALGECRNRFELLLFWYSYPLKFDEFKAQFISVSHADDDVNNWSEYIYSIYPINSDDWVIIKEVLEEYFWLFHSISVAGIYNPE